MSRYLVGIDLGTTHTVVAYGDGEAPGGLPQIFPIEQLVAAGEVAGRPLLASMRYHPAAGEIPAGDRVLPWGPDPFEDPVPDAIMGALAQVLGSRVPGRLVTSAKSWLSHPGVDRTAPILPWGAPPEVKRVSPLDASAGYLRHVRHAWHQRFPGHPLESQELVLTVPASFDEAARRLTVEAARLAGLPRVRLVEEPQAACYDWLSRHAEGLEEALAGVRTLLVCDVGGGTTDLSLIRVDRDGGRPSLVRIGVGDHLMLGGDNMDLALAHLAERRLARTGQPLGAAQLNQLVQQCRGAKERLLAPGAPGSASVTLLGAGARLIGQALTTELGRAEVEGLVVDGFFPETDPGERPQRRGAGIVELGLRYAADPAVTRHLAAFLADHAQVLGALSDRGVSPAQGFAVPDAVLLNGGVFRSEALCQRLLRVLGDWRGGAPVRLRNQHPELAVARGAVAYALARRGQGTRIGGGSARNLLLQVEGKGGEPRRGVCLLPRGSEEGQELRLRDRVFSLRLGQPVRFNLMATLGGRGFALGELVDLDQTEYRALPPLATVLDGVAGSETGAREVQVQLAAVLTDIGTLEIDCVATGDEAPDREPEPPGRWRLELQLRGQDAKPGEGAAAVLPGAFCAAVERIERVYGARIAGVGPKECKQLQGDLERLLGRRLTWETGLLRALFGALWDGVRRRRRSADHEWLWFNLAGFCLRPGFGHPLDDWRVRQLWSIYEQGVQYQDEARNWAQWWTLWRRVSGGLDRAQQLRILGDLEGRLGGAVQRGGKGAKAVALDDLVRLAAGLERLPSGHKERLGARLLGAGRRPTESPQRWWALGRLGARVPFYGSVHDVVSRDLAQEWLEQVLKLDWRTLEPAAFAATQLARLSGDRERDLSLELRERVVERLRNARAPQTWIALVQTVTELDSADESLIFGESLPPGLRLVE
jgi:molecular chaperone DnaK (HSP70)